MTADWVERAACTSPEADPDWWDTDVREHNKIARQWCSRCPVQRECLDAALAEEGASPKNHRAGIRGGLSPEQRRALHEQSAAAAKRAER